VVRVLDLQLSGGEGLARLLFVERFEHVHVGFAPFAMPQEHCSFHVILSVFFNRALIQPQQFRFVVEVNVS
jgi:hypothetical protein